MSQPELTRLLREVGAVDAPAAPTGGAVSTAGLGPSVRASVTRTRSLRVGAAATLVLAVGAAAAVSLSGRDAALDTVATVPRSTPPPTSAAPSRPPSTLPTPPPAPLSAAPTPLPTRGPRPTAQASATAVRTPGQPAPTSSAPAVAPRSPSPQPRPTSPPPRPFAGPGLRVVLDGPVRSGSRTVTLTYDVSDTDGRVLSASVDWGDGSATGMELGARCGDRDGTEPERLSATGQVSHTYPAPQNPGARSYTAVLRVLTGSSCRATPRESAEDGHTVEVD